MVPHQHKHKTVKNQTPHSTPLHPPHLHTKRGSRGGTHSRPAAPLGRCGLSPAPVWLSSCWDTSPLPLPVSCHRAGLGSQTNYTKCMLWNNSIIYIQFDENRKQPHLRAPPQRMSERPWREKGGIRPLTAWGPDDRRRADTWLHRDGYSSNGLEGIQTKPVIKPGKRRLYGKGGMKTCRHEMRRWSLSKAKGWENTNPNGMKSPC